MSFKFAARTILELGKELISSDEVALYELIKNAVDAGSPRMEIIINVQMRHSDYRQVVALDGRGGKDKSRIITFHQEQTD